MYDIIKTDITKRRLIMAQDFNPDKIEIKNTDIEVEKAPTTMEIMAEIEKLKAENEKQKEEAKKLEATNAKLKRGIIETPEREAEGGAVSDIIHGYREVFEKEYSFNVLGKEPITFKVVIKPTTALDRAKIAGLVVDMGEGQVPYMDATSANMIQAVATFKTVGEEIPDWLVDIDKLYRLDILLGVYSDYEEWLATFRQGQAH